MVEVEPVIIALLLVHHVCKRIQIASLLRLSFVLSLEWVLSGILGLKLVSFLFLLRLLVKLKVEEILNLILLIKLYLYLRFCILLENVLQQSLLLLIRGLSFLLIRFDSSWALKIKQINTFDLLFLLWHILIGLNLHGLIRHLLLLS